MRLERFDPTMQDIFEQAQELMRQHSHTQLDVEHIFLALLRHHAGLSEQVLSAVATSPTTLATQVEQELAKLPKIHGQYGYGNQIYITPRTQRLIRRAEASADAHNKQLITATHLWIALSHDDDGPNARIMRTAGLTASHVAASLASDATEILPSTTTPTLEARVAALEHELAALRQATVLEAPATPIPPDAQDQALQIAALEQENQRLRNLLHQAQRHLEQACTLLAQATGERSSVV